MRLYPLIETSSIRHIPFGRPLVLAGMLLVLSGCIKFPKINPATPDVPNVPDDPQSALWVYPFDREVPSQTVSLILTVDDRSEAEAIEVEIPPLKYDKSLLVLLTQDDCKHSAFSATWAAIHGKPLCDTMFYNAVQLLADDLPPNARPLQRTLGSTDGTGREVRFSFTTTLAAEWPYMSHVISVNPGFTGNYYRFFMQSGLVWDNVREMANYGTGIAFHDLNTDAVNNVDSLLVHYDIAQQITRQQLGGRGCKMLAEPNGNKTYVTAAQSYAPIQTIVLQGGGETLYPFAVEDDLVKKAILRNFKEPEQQRERIEQQLQRPPAEREAICIGAHGTDSGWAELLLWLNDTCGKDGADCVWMPSHEEYFEYNYYRQHARINSTLMSENRLRLDLDLEGGMYFYYPSLTLLIRNAGITDIAASEEITGLTWSTRENDVLVNFDCRKALPELAEHFVARYEKSHRATDLRDALYFVAQLRDSPFKTQLNARLQ